MLDSATSDRLSNLLRREGRSLFQYLYEVPPWVGLRDQNALADMRAMAGAELQVTEQLSLWLQKQIGGTISLGAFPDFTPYNDAALGFLLPMIVSEQKQNLAELEADRKLIADAEAGAFLDQLIELKKKHTPQLEDLQPGRYTFTTAMC